ncbi:MAG: hypothetical protein AAGK33_01240 [Pseudomonadota bacterium]
MNSLKEIFWRRALEGVNGTVCPSVLDKFAHIDWNALQAEYDRLSKGNYHESRKARSYHDNVVSIGVILNKKFTYYGEKICPPPSVLPEIPNRIFARWEKNSYGSRYYLGI